MSSDPIWTVTNDHAVKAFGHLASAVEEFDAFRTESHDSDAQTHAACQLHLSAAIIHRTLLQYYQQSFENQNPV